ncbi:MAG TPA: hypothetical protein VE978_13370 [Chitinophagales bacterium]|nr:hypothetical protein [Chitinophagales bacterium]
MKKKLLLIFFSFMTTYSFGQELTWKQRFTILQAIDKTIDDYEQFLPLSDPDNFDSIGTHALNSFRKLFDVNAGIFDDMCPSIFDGNYDNPMLFGEKQIDDYLANIKRNYPSGFTSAIITNVAVDYTDMISQRAVYVLIEKKITATTKPVGVELNSAMRRNRWRIEVTDTVELVLGISKDFNSVLIKRITHDGASPSFKIQNDEDNDFVIDKGSDALDKCPNFHGYIKWNGCDYPQGPAVTGFILAGLGGTIGNSYKGFGENSPDQNYVTDYGVSNPQSKKSFGFGQSAAFQLEWFPGRDRHWGVGAGADFFHTSDDISVPKYKAIYSSTDTFGTPFTQLISSKDGIEEKIEFYSITPAIYAKYKRSFAENSRWGWKINAGVGYRLYPNLSTVKVEKATFSYEAIYSYNGGNIGVADDNSSDDIRMVESFIDSTSGKGTAAALIHQLDSLGYNVRINQPFENSNYPVNYLKGGFTFIFEPTITHQWKNKSIYWNFGLQLLFDVPVKNNNTGSYKLTDKKYEYNTLLAGVGSISNTYVGFTVGLSLSLVKGYEQVNTH